MNKIRTISAVLLAIPLIVFGGNSFVGLFDLPAADESAGEQLLQSMRDGGLMALIALSHVVVGVFLLVPRLRFLGALLQLPISLGILGFHFTMLPAGLAPAVVMVVLNAGALANPRGFLALVHEQRQGTPP